MLALLIKAGADPWGAWGCHTALSVIFNKNSCTSILEKIDSKIEIIHGNNISVVWYRQLA